MTEKNATELVKRFGFKLDDYLLDMEISLIKAALKLENGNLSKAAERLGVKRTTLYSRIEAFGITRGE